MCTGRFCVCCVVCVIRHISPTNCAYARVIVYSFGVVMCEMLSGELPFKDLRPETAAAKVRVRVRLCMSCWHLLVSRNKPRIHSQTHRRRTVLWRHGIQQPSSDAPVDICTQRAECAQG
jgi:hypothetical protein